MQWLYSIDLTLFYWINHHLQHPWLDVLFPFITNLHRHVWIQAFFLPIGLGYWLYKKRTQALRILLLILVTVATTDLFSYLVLKSSFSRLRPSQDPQVEALVRVPYNPKSFSFPSNHAVNSFALACLLSLFYPHLRWLWLLSASLISFSRVYVGVHYPSDILGGGLIGHFLVLGLKLFFVKAWDYGTTYIWKSRTNH
jgi:undecaprenyl-diphosphatase